MINKIYSRLYRFLKKKATVFALKGNNYLCSCCGYKAIAFLPGGNKKRANAICPKCGSKERHRSYWLYLKEKTELFSRRKNMKVLHVAPEFFFFKVLSSQPNLEYHPIDKFEKGYQYPSGTKNMDITDIKYPDDYFDAVICVHVLEHVPDDRKALREFLRVLKSGGWALLQSPLNATMDKTFEDFSITDPELRLKHFGQKDHVRIYGNDYPDRLQEAGFTVTRDSYLKHLPHEIVRQSQLSTEEIFFCQKN